MAKVACKLPVTDLYAQLRLLIVSGQLAPGAALIERLIASRFGVSRTPVREALVRLKQEGFATETRIDRYTRLSVAAVTEADGCELFLIVGAIEGVGAREAAALPDGDRKSLARTMSEINEAMLASAHRRPADPVQVNNLDIRFHRSYVEVGAGCRLLKLHNSVKPQAERYERIYTSALIHDVEQSVSEHEAVIRSIRDGNPRRAQRAVETNWLNASKRLRRAIRMMGEKGKW